ncbi:MAG: DUF5058 family protein [Ruminococcaceae bacterium]|nr:DUF5058 family protein [Oscillospiraceae bacterium]
MDFSVNSPILFVLVGLIILAVLGQSVFFLVKALRRAKELGMDQKKLRHTMRSAAMFTVAPAVAIVISVMTLSKDLGLPLPWLRLSVVGSMSYETIAATNAESAMGLVFGQVTSLTAQQYVTIAWVMTLSIMVGIWLVPVLAKRLQSGMDLMEKRDKKWGDTFQNALFIGMISAFLGYVFCDFSTIFVGDTSGLIPVCVMAVSALLMVLTALGMKVTGWKWLSEYALPISLLGGMAAAIPITAWLG